MMRVHNLAKIIELRIGKYSGRMDVQIFQNSVAIESKERVEDGLSVKRVGRAPTFALGLLGATMDSETTNPNSGVEVQSRSIGALNSTLAR